MMMFKIRMIAKIRMLIKMNDKMVQRDHGFNQKHGKSSRPATTKDLQHQEYANIWATKKLLTSQTLTRILVKPYLGQKV